jgi:hypothetical protein
VSPIKSNEGYILATYNVTNVPILKGQNEDMERRNGIKARLKRSRENIKSCSFMTGIQSQGGVM